MEDGNDEEDGFCLTMGKKMGDQGSRGGANMLDETKR